VEKDLPTELRQLRTDFDQPGRIFATVSGDEIQIEPIDPS
jgi:hypothetical protein